MIEAAILLPTLLLLFLGMWHFSLRMQNQSRCAMAARYACWCGGHKHYDDMETLVKENFFPNSGAHGLSTITINKKHMGPDTGIGVVTTLLGFLGDNAKKNVEVTLTCRQNGLPFAAPVSASDVAFIWAGASNAPITAACVDGDCWQNVNKVAKNALQSLWPF